MNNTTKVVKKIILSLSPLIPGILIFPALSSCQPSSPESEDITIYFDANGGTFSDGSTRFELKTKRDTTWGEIISGEIPEPARTDSWLFDHWSKDPETLISPDLNETFSDGTPLYAHYTAHTHEYSYYHIDEETCEVFGVCEVCHQIVPLTLDEIKANAGKILIKRQDSTDYDLVDCTIAQAINSSPIIDNTVVLYLFGNSDYIYSLKDIVSPIGNEINVKLFEVAGAQTIVDCGNTGSYHIETINVSLEIHDIDILGATENTIFYDSGIQCPTLICDNCKLIGMQTAYANKCEFTNCIIDSSVITPYEESGQMKTDYGMYEYSCQDLNFNNCHFISKGKALKVYNEGSSCSYQIKLTNCDFTLISDPTLSEGQIKPCVAIDSTYQTKDTRFHVILTGCSMNDYPDTVPIVAETDVAEGSENYPIIEINP